MVNPKRKDGRKAVDISHSYDEVDRISCLGDTLLSHILSYLTTKEAITTSALSKRWKYVWTETPVLHFDWIQSRTKEERDRFASFFTRVLDMNRIYHLKKFRLPDFCCFDLVHINRWFDNLSRRRIDEIDLSFHGSQVNCQLLVDFLTCVQPERLSFMMYSGLIHVEFTTLTKFSNLNIISFLHLNTQHSASMNRLLACCPVLESLTLLYCEWKQINIDSSTLKILNLSYGGGFIPSLLLKTPNLQQFFIECYEQSNPFDYLPMEGLVEAKVFFISIPLAILQAISRAKTLDLENCHIDESVRRAISSNQVSFRNLTHLKFSAIKGSLQYMICILKCCPNLQSFVFDKPDSCASERRSSKLPAEYLTWNPPAHVPECLLSCLKSVQIEFNEDGECEDCWCMAGYFIKSSRVLKEFKLKSRIRNSFKENILKELLMLPRASTSCRVMFNCS